MMAGLSVVAFKLWSVAAILAISLAGSFLPLKLRSVSAEKRNMVTDLSRFFTAGVFLGVGLIHMLPEAADNLHKLGIGRVGGKDFPLAYFICALGIVIIWFLEQHTFRDRSRMMAVAANAHKRGGASICFVRVEPVSTYGVIVETPEAPHTPVVRLRSAPATYMAPTLEDVDLRQALLAQLASEGVNGGGQGAPVLGEPLEDVRLMIPADGRSTEGEVIGDAKVLVAVRTKGDGHGGKRGSRQSPVDGGGDRTEPAGTHGNGQDEGRGRRGSGENSHPSSSRVSSHRTSSTSGEGESLEGGSQRCTRGGPQRRGDRLKRSRSQGVWSPQAINCPLVTHEDLFTHPEHRHRHPHPEAMGHGAHSHQDHGSSEGSPCMASEERQLHEHSHSAEHHHVVLSGSSGMAYILASLFSLHSFVVGAAFGIGREIDQGAISLLIAVLAHKGTEAFSVGVQFAAEGVPLTQVVTIMLLYCAMTPLGVFVGMAELLVRGSTGRVVESLTQAFGAGTVLYIVMMQLTEQDGMRALPNRWVQAMLILLGLTIMSAVALVT